MKLGLLANLDECLRMASDGGEPVEIADDGPIRGSDLFSLALLRFAAKLGEPDFPGSSGGSLREDIEVEEGPLAVWDFDYYLLPLALSMGSGKVLLRQHSR